jgi:hypothetical protein
VKRFTQFDVAVEKLWPRLVGFYPEYAFYQSRTDREIPVVILSSVAEA